MIDSAATMPPPTRGSLFPNQQLRLIPWPVVPSSVTLAPRPIATSKRSKNRNSFFKGLNMIFFRKRAKIKNSVVTAPGLLVYI
jgi:hypothetical protein